MKLIVGLGNPGSEYENTRHNVGFMLLDLIANDYNLKFSKEKMQGIYTEYFDGTEKIILLKPQTYMNLSGECVKKYVDFYNISLEDLLIIHDDMNIPLGTCKLRMKGSSGGHNGLKNIEQHLKTNVYNRLKIGVSKPTNQDTVSYVLGRFSKDEKEELNKILEKGKDIIKDFPHLTFENLMNKYN